MKSVCVPSHSRKRTMKVWDLHHFQMLGAIDSDEGDSCVMNCS